MFRFLYKVVRNLSIRLLVIGAATVMGLTVIWPGGHTPDQPPAVDQNRSGQVLLALDLVVLPVKDYVRTGDPQAPHEFERNLRRCLATLARLGESGEEEREVARALEGKVLLIEALGRQVIGVANPRGNATLVPQVEELVRLRDSAVLATNPLREADVRIARQQTDAASRVTYRLGGAGLATLGLCLAGATGLARLCVG